MAINKGQMSLKNLPTISGSDISRSSPDAPVFAPAYQSLPKRSKKAITIKEGKSP